MKSAVGCAPLRNVLTGLQLVAYCTCTNCKEEEWRREHGKSGELRRSQAGRTQTDCVLEGIQQMSSVSSLFSLSVNFDVNLADQSHVGCDFRPVIKIN